MTNKSNTTIIKVKNGSSPGLKANTGYVRNAW